MGYVADVFDSETLAELPGHAGDRPRALFDRRREPAAERAADSHRLRARPDRASATTATWSTPSELRDELVRQGSIFQSSSDTEVVLHLYARSKARRVEDAIVESVSQVQGAFSFVMLTKDRLIAVRDPHGFRPLALGRLGDACVVCSETCAMDLIGATYVRDVEPGEVLVISADGHAVDQAVRAGAARALRLRARLLRAARQLRVRQERQRSAHRTSAAILAREQPVDADVVVPVPDSGVCAAMGYAEESGIPLRMGLIRNHYVGRTFIQPQSVDPPLRREGEAEPGAQHPRGQARGAGRRLDRARHDQPQDRARWCGRPARSEVHVRISCPPTISPCFYGVDTPRRSELIAATHTLDEIRSYLEADSVGYLSLEGLLSAVGDRQRRPTAARATPGSIRSRFRATRRATCSSR